MMRSISPCEEVAGSSDVEGAKAHRAPAGGPSPPPSSPHHPAYTAPMSDTKRPRDDSADALAATPSKMPKVEEEESKVDVKSAMDAAGTSMPLLD